MYRLVKNVTPADNIWNAFLCGTVMDYVKDDDNMSALSAALFGTTGQTIWACCALALGFETLTGDAFATEISPELQLFMGAYGAYELELCDSTHDYSTYPSNWLSNVVSQFATNYTAAGDA